MPINQNNNVVTPGPARNCNQVLETEFAAPPLGSLGGIATSGVPTSGQVLTATGAATATWQTPSAGGSGWTEETLTNPANNTVLTKNTTHVRLTTGNKTVMLPIAAAIGTRMDISFDSFTYGNLLTIKQSDGTPPLDGAVVLSNFALTRCTQTSAGWLVAILQYTTTP